MTQEIQTQDRANDAMKCLALLKSTVATVEVIERVVANIEYTTTVTCDDISTAARDMLHGIMAAETELLLQLSEWDEGR